MALNDTVGVEIHYMASCYCMVGDTYLLAAEDGYHEVPTPKRELVTEWLEGNYDGNDHAVLNSVWEAMQNGVQEVTGVRSASEALGVRSMMVGDVVALQTNNRGPRRWYVVAPCGFTRVS